MAKFSGVATKPATIGPRTQGTITTHEGGFGYWKDPKTELYTLAVTNPVDEPAYYESGPTRDNRLRDLAALVTQFDPHWVAEFACWLRHDGMRSAALVVAAEYAAVRPTEPRPREVIASVLQRPDEPAEMLGYWLKAHGRALPMPVKRGIADAAVQLYTERAAIKYDTPRHGVRMGDVIELCHPSPTTAQQSALFRHLLDRRHGRFHNTPRAVGQLRDMGLHTLVDAYSVDSFPPQARRDALRRLGAKGLAEAGYTWERLSGWLPGGMDAEAWEHIIPSMGYLALLRNLRNFEEAGVHDTVLARVALKLAQPDEVLASQLYPYRFWSAYKNIDTNYFGPTLERALETSVDNVPVLPGRTLVAVDTSGSMEAPVAARSKVSRVEVGALFAAALHARSDTDLIIYADKGHLVGELPQSILRATQKIEGMVGSVGHGTQTWPSVVAHYQGQDRIVVFTDMADHPTEIPGIPNVPVYVWDLSGYTAANIDPTQSNRFLFGGFTDASFRLIPLLEAGVDIGWPWENLPSLSG